MNKVIALALSELRLLLRNKTAAVTTIVLPIALGLFWAWTMGGSSHLVQTALVLNLQIAIVLAMGIYVTSTVAIVTRRHTKVLKRLRTSGLSDAGLLIGIILPSVVVALVQLVLFAVIDVLADIPLPIDALPVIFAVVGGIVLSIAAALATTIVTANPERAQITTLPLTFLLLGAGIVMLMLPDDGWWRLLVALPGAAVGELVRLSYFGGTWDVSSFGLPAALPALIALVAWPVVFAIAARRRFRWDDRVQ